MTNSEAEHSGAQPGANLYGSVDLGTNTCRLLIARLVESEGTRQFTHIDSLSRVVRFGENLEQSRKLSLQAMDRAYLALEECRKRLQFYHVPYMRCVATAACRRAENTDEFVQEAFKKTGIRIEVITPQEESELAVAGCAELFDDQFSHAIVFDIGGGSTELVWTKILPNQNFKVIDSISFPHGFATLKDQLKDPEKRVDITQFFSHEVNEFALRHDIYGVIREGKAQMIGASGTITTLAAIILGLESYDKTRVHEAVLSRENLKNVIRYLNTTHYSDRLNHPCIGQQRAESIMGGIALFEAIYDILNVDFIIAADRGVREGILHTLAKEHAPKTK